MNEEQAFERGAEVPANARAPVWPRSSVLRFDSCAVLAWLLGFAPVLYLALRGGGYDLVVRSEVGLAASWLLLLLAAFGMLQLAGLGRAQWICIALLLAFVAWTGIAALWSVSPERTVAEFGRDAAYLALFVLGTTLVRRNTAGALATGIGVAFAVVSLLAVCSRVQPSLFPADKLARFFAKSHTRLGYPLNYADGTGNLLAIGIPLLLMIATRAKTLVGQAVGAAIVPVAVLGIVMTASRGAVITAIVGVGLFYVLASERLPKLAMGLVAAGASGVLVAALLHLQAVRNGLSTPSALTERHQLIALIVVVCAATGLLQAGIVRRGRSGRGARGLELSRRTTILATIAALTLAVAVAIAIGLPGELSHQWSVFKQTKVTGVSGGNLDSRLTTVSGSHRYQYWRAAVQAYDTKPLTGIGPGTFEFWWAQHGSIYEYIRNAHSLYLETLAEAGLIGLAVLGTFLLVVLSTGIARAVRAPPSSRATLAGATAAFAAFLAAAAYDWAWQLPVIPVAAMLLGSVILACGEQSPPGSLARWRWLVPRAAVAVLAAATFVAIAVPFAETAALRSSQAEAAVNDYHAALDNATTAQQLEPYAANPVVQRALIMESTGHLSAARAAMTQAVAHESTNWQLRLLRARLDAESGLVSTAQRDYASARALDPRSPATAGVAHALPRRAHGTVRCAPLELADISQSVETIPGVSCSVTYPGLGSSRAGGGREDRLTPPQGRSLPASTSRQLSSGGPTGRGVERLVASTGTAPADVHSATPAGSSSSVVNPRGSGDGVPGGLLHPLLTGAASGGVGLPLFLGVALALVVMSSLRRRKRSS